MRRTRWTLPPAVMMAVPAVVLALTGLAPTADAAISPTGTTGTTGTTYTWVGSSQNPQADNHSWSDPLNWSPNGVPADGDSVSIAPPDPNHCVAHVDGVPTVTLAILTLSVSTGCGASINGGAITVTGGMTWDSGTISTPMTLAAGSTSTLLPAKLKELTQNMTVAGTLTLAGTASPAALKIDAPNQLVITSTGTLASTGTSDITYSSCCVNPAKVVNGGTISVADGTLHVDAVELDQNNAVQIAAGAQLITGSAPLVLGDGATYGGNGRWFITNGATARFAGKQTLGAGFHLELGNDGSGGDSLAGSGQLLGTGEFDWTGGTLAADLTIGHGVTMHVYGANPGNGRRYLSGHDGSTPVGLTNHGTVLIDQQATIATQYQARLVVASNGSLTMAPGTVLSSMSCCVSPDQVVNSGGQVAVQQGTPAPQLDGVAYVATGGTTTVDKGGELQLTGGPQSSLTDTTVTGHGRLTVADPTAVSGTITLANKSPLQLAERGSLDGTAVIEGTGKVDWQGGGMSGAIAVSAAGGVVLSGSAAKSMNNIGGGSQPSSLAVSTKLVLTSGKKAAHNIFNINSSSVTGSGTTTVGTWVDLDGGTLANTGTLTIDPGKRGKVFSQYNNVIDNYGTAALASGTLTATSGYQSLSGTTTLAAHTKLVVPYSSSPLDVLAGTLTGTGKVVGNLSNDGGVVDPGTVNGSGKVGTLTVSGNYTQTGGKLQLDLAVTGNDQLAVGGAASVAGGFEAHTMKGYTPAGGDKRTGLTAGALTWTVTCAVTSGPGSKTGHWQPNAGATKLALVWKSGSQTTC